MSHEREAAQPLGAKAVPVAADDDSKSGLHKPLALDPMVSMVVGSVRQRIHLSAVRSLVSCVGVGEAEPFGLPPQALMLTRMRVNAHYFFANYLLMTLFVFAFLLCVPRVL